MRRARRRVFGTRTAVVFHGAYRPPMHRIIDPERADKILGYLVRQGSLARSAIREPAMADLAMLRLVHDDAYLESLDDPAVLAKIFGEPELEVPGKVLVDQQRWAVGGTVLAAQLALHRRPDRLPVIQLGGGFHHAHRGHGEGFCIFNDVAVAVAVVREQGFAGRVLVVDLDLHPGNGTREIFAADESVFTFSMHGTEWGDPTRACADLSVELGSGVSDRAYLSALDRYLPEAIDQARPELVFFVAGVDVAADDLLGSFRLTAEAILARDQRVVEALGQLPFVWVLAGGYGPDAYRYTARSLDWLLTKRDRPLPSQTDLELARFRKIARSLSRAELGPGETDLDELRIADVLPSLRGAPSERRFLGFYTAYGLELALSRYGVLETFTRLGYPRVDVELDPDHPTGELVRITSSDARRDRLLELVVREAKDHPPFRFLFVEWLLSQNPRLSAEAVGGLMPGQEHPGLGLGQKIIGMLLMACERLGYDGLTFTPSHFHVACSTRDRATFVDPEREAEFLALKEVLGRLEVREAAAALEGGRVRDADGRAVRYRPSPMAWAVSPGARAHFGGADYAAAVEAASAARVVRLEAGSRE